MNRGRIKVAVALVSLSLMTSPATAHLQAPVDDDDSPGTLDIVVVRHRHRVYETAQTHPSRQSTSTELSFRLVTYEKWEGSVLSGGHNFISFEFNLDGDDGIERCLVVTKGRNEMLGRMYKDCKYAEDELAGSASVSRPDKHSIHTAFPRKLLRRGIESYRWRAVTSYEDEQTSECAPQDPPSAGGYGTCLDATKWKSHRL